MIITVAGFKGGVGKSVTAIHLARYLSDDGITVLADGDLNRSASNWAERGDPPFTVCDRHSIDSAGEFDHLVIDTQARPDDKELHELASVSDVLLMPTTPTAFSIEAMVLTMVTLNEIDQEKLRIVLTIVPPAPSKAGDNARQALEQTGLPICENWIRRYSCYLKAEEQGCTVAELKGDRYAGIAWSDYRALGKELCHGA
jgi:chromosome partitioning protein